MHNVSAATRPAAEGAHAPPHSSPLTAPHSLNPHKAAHTFLRRLSQKEAMSSAELDWPTGLLQNCSKASLRALWNREWLLKQSVTYCTHSPGEHDDQAPSCRASHRALSRMQVLDCTQAAKIKGSAMS